MNSLAPFVSLAPALALLAYLGGGALVFWALGARQRFSDKEAENRVTGLSTPGLRLFFSWLMSPWVRMLLRTGLPANAITSVSLAMALAAGVALAAGHFSLGGWIFLLASVCDYFDGRIARARSQASAQGAAFDSIVDRYSEAAVLMGLCWYYRSSWVLVPALFALSGSLLVPYVRAKAEALDVQLAEVGWLQRPERAVLLGTTTALAPLGDYLLQTPLPGDAATAPAAFWMVVVGLLILGMGTQLTAVQRTVNLLRQLSPQTQMSAEGSGWRAVLASMVATASDALLVFALMGLSSSHALPFATAAGCVLGAVVNFSMNRLWAFRATDHPIVGQGGRYVLASLTSAGLNAAGVGVVGLLAGVPPMVSWLLVRGTVFGVWTYPLYRTYVFAPVPQSCEHPHDISESHA